MNKKTVVLYFAWIVSIIATAGSLYFSEIMHFIPCKLCWYQRILMYPQVIILGIACYKEDHQVFRYILPMSIIGASISFYHYCLEKVPGFKEAVPFNCSANGEIPCTTEWINWFGFVTIPFLALTAFSIIITCFVYIINAKDKK